MHKGRLSIYSAIALGLLGGYILLSLVLYYSGINISPGRFLIESFSYASFFIPAYIFLALILALKMNFHSKWVILLTLTIIPFLTLVVFLKVYLDIDTSIPVVFIATFIGRKEGSFLLFLLLLIEVLLIYVLSLKLSREPSLIIKNDMEQKDELSSEPPFPRSILLPGVSTERLGTKLEDSVEESAMSFPIDRELTDVNIPELPSLGKLRSTNPVQQEDILNNNHGEDKDISIDFGEPDEIEENIPELEDEIFSEIGTDHLINADISESDRDNPQDSEISAPGIQKKLTYANYNIPEKDILNDYSGGSYWVIDDATRMAAEILRETLEEFKIKAEVTGIKKGPVITMFEILPAPGVKLSKIANLADNIAMRLAASRVRIVAPIPGKHAVGIEIPNKERAKVSFKEMLQDDKFQDSKNEIPIAIGKDITGNTQIIDLVKTPHLLIAGATGSGKSVCVNALICSILYKRNPDQVRLLLIDPKIVELKLYNDIPHLLTPVITEPKRAFQALQYCIYIMEQRYALLDGMGVRDIRSYNKKIIKKRIATKKLPYIVVVVDEFADLIATSGKELESILARLAAMARAVGIHLVLATQRPSIDVITGLIKANIPSRIAFMVSNKIDSRIILDTAGADKLLGQGDMLFSSAWNPSLIRIQGAFLSDAEVEAVTDYVKTLGEPDYIDDEIFYDDEEDSVDTGNYSTNDPLMDKAIETVVTAGKASASYLQRRLQIGYNRAARIVEEMEARGIVGPPNGSKPREILHVPDRVRDTPEDDS
ncbi:MAG: DUF87 domain-containing protein [Spirochaetaceae bacterium]|nr:DUF87 domain-containing protein [Spirochaetaceae bacterium]